MNFSFRKNLPVALAAISVGAGAANAETLLSGTVIGTELSVDYDTRQPSTTVNTREMAFDGDLSTCFASYGRSYTWVGLDLGKPHVITRVAWSPRDDGYGPERVRLGVFQGANRPDFLDAVPIHMIESAGVIGQYSSAEVDCSRGFRYVRYVGPSDARCNIAELQFYGEPGEGDDSRLWQLTNLPTVVINTVDAEEPYDKEHNIPARVIVISDNGADILDAEATTRLRGNASMQFPKKPYRIKFEKKQTLLDAPSKAKKWTLINNYGDKTLMRNIVAFEAARRAGMEYVPFCRPVDVILNGEYKGNYQLCDQIEVREGRVDLEEMAPEDISGEALTGGYLLEVDGYADQEISWFTSRNGIPVTIKAPADDEIVPQQYDYIKGVFDEVDRRVFSNKYSGEGSYRELFDVPSFLQHFIVGEFSGNTDTYWSTYMYKHRNDPKLYVGPVWDFDIAFDNDSRTYPLSRHEEYVYLSGSAASNMRTMVTRIVSRDKATAAELAAMWADLRDNRDYNQESFTAYIDQVAADIDASQRLNFVRWPIMNKWVHMNPKVFNSYADAVSDLKKYVTMRIGWLDNKIGYTPGQSGVERIDAYYDKLTVTVEAGAVSVGVLPDGLSFKVYDTAGRFVGAGVPGESVQLPARGLYIVRADNGISAKIVY